MRAAASAELAVLSHGVDFTAAVTLPMADVTVLRVVRKLQARGRAARPEESKVTPRLGRPLS
jgi:hypothetical protein